MNQVDFKDLMAFPLTPFSNIYYMFLVQVAVKLFILFI